MYPKPVSDRSCHIFRGAVFLPNLMPLLSCHLPWPAQHLSGSLNKSPVSKTPIQLGFTGFFSREIRSSSFEILSWIGNPC